METTKKQSIYTAQKIFDDKYKNREGVSSNFLNVINPMSWYKTFPFEIVAVYSPKDNSDYKADSDNTNVKQYVYSLPIPPEAISTTMVPASSVTPTLDGYVEETTQTKIWIVSLSGTTGISPNRADSKGETDTTAPATKFRETKQNLGLISGALGRVETMASYAQSIAKDATSGDLVEMTNKLFTTTPIFTESAVSKDSNGYTEIHLLHKFLIMYAKEKSIQPNNWQLLFRNYKDGQEFRVVVQDFKVNKTKSSPFLYNYSISFKCWNLQPINNHGREIDRFAKDGDLYGLKTFTITGTLTKLANLTAKIANNPIGAITDSLTGGGVII